MEENGIFNAASSFNKLWNTKILSKWKKFNGIFFRKSLPEKIKDGDYIINPDEYANVGIDWIALFCSRNEIVCFDSFGVEQVPEEIKEFNWNKNMKANIFRIQANDSVMCGCFCIGFIDFMLAGKKLTDFRNLLSPYDFEKNYDIVLSYFKDEWIQFHWNW